MIKQISKNLLIIIFFITTSCGYKALEGLDTYNLNIKEFNTSGDKRINFKIKNNLIFKSSKINKINLIIDVHTTKKKEIKEKNIKKEITKYKISSISKVKLNFFENNLNKELVVTSHGDYQVSESYSSDLQSERRLNEDLANDLSSKIRNQILLILNDL